MTWFYPYTNKTKKMILDCFRKQQFLISTQIAIMLEMKGKSLTEQALHEHLTELVEKGVLERNKREYYLSPEWFKEMQEAVKKIETKIYRKKVLEQLNSYGIPHFKKKGWINEKGGIIVK